MSVSPLADYWLQVLSDVTGEEFGVFMEMLSKLQFLATGMPLVM